MNFNDKNLSYERFKAQFETIQNPVDTALIATIYCGYARVGEIVRGRYTKTLGIKASNVIFTPTHLFLTITTEKTNQVRRVPSSRKKEDWLHEPIRNHLNIISEEEELFPFSTRWAEKRFEKCFGTQHIHLLRHWACSHAVEGKRSEQPLDIPDIMLLGGWTDMRTPFKIYSHMRAEQVAQKL